MTLNGAKSIAAISAAIVRHLELSRLLFKRAIAISSESFYEAKLATGDHVPDHGWLMLVTCALIVALDAGVP